MSDIQRLRAEYIRNIFAKPDDALNHIESRIHQETDPIYLRPEDAKILEFLIKISGVKRIVEVGTLAGYSAVWMARALPEDGMVYTIEHDEKRAQMAQKTFESVDVGDKIMLLKGKACDVLSDLKHLGQFDMIFIDADKIGYCDYLDWADENIRPGGLIIGDNTFLFESVYLGLEDASEKLKHKLRPQAIDVMRRFNQRLADNTKYCTMMLSTREGMTVALKI